MRGKERGRKREGEGVDEGEEDYIDGERRTREGGARSKLSVVGCGIAWL